MPAVPASPLVTTFQPARPRLIRSSEAKRRARLNGELYDVVAVPTSPMRSVRDGERREQGERLEPVEVVGRRVRGDELAVDDEDEVECRRLGCSRLLDVPVDVDARVAGDLGVEPAVVLPGPPVPVRMTPNVM